MKSLNLKEYAFKHHYDHVLGEEMLEKFYVPMLKNSNTYDRVAGYFSSAVLSHASAGFAEFCKSSNPRDPIPKFRLIVGARLNPKDEIVILHMNDPQMVTDEMEKIILKNIDNLEDEIDFDKNRLRGLAWMIKNNLLDIKVGALYNPKTNEVLPHQEAEFHSKFGIASDGKNTIYFGGSANETKRAWLDNYETIDVSRSWAGNESLEKIDTYQKKFEELWSNNRKEKGVVVVDFPHAAKNKILDKFPPSDPRGSDEVNEAKMRKQYLGTISGKSKNWNTSYVDIDKWKHQKEAMEWFLDENQANGVGIYQMATGSGKTRTAINTARKAVSENLVEKTIICVPKTLENQWQKELAEHYPERRMTFWWKSGINDSKKFLRLGKDSVMIVSHFFLPDLLELAQKYPAGIENTLLIIDEMHHIGSNKYKKIGKSKEQIEELVDVMSFREDMFEPFLMRLGLSATPWDEYDNQRNQLIINGFINNRREIKDLNGDWKQVLINEKDVFNFDLIDGIKKGILCEFEYIPLEYTPSEEDFMKRKEAFKKIPPHLPQRQKDILGRIMAAHVFKTSKNKIPVFSEWLNINQELDRCVLFVADKEFGRYITKTLGDVHGIFKFREFFEGEHMDTLQKFAIGDLNQLIACHRISEGIDIQTVSRVILFSSNFSQLETIQRIGRALRIDPNNPDKKAIIVDFIYDQGEDQEGCPATDIRRKIWLEEIAKTRRRK